MSTRNTTIDPPLRVDLLHAKERFDAANNAFYKRVKESDGVVWLPDDFVLEAGDSARSVMADRWYGIHKQHKGVAEKVLPPTGLMCGDEALVDLALALNASKVVLQDIVVGLRNELKRPDEVRALLKGVGMSDYDLMKTYRKVYVFTHYLHSISWSWAIGNSKVEPITVANLLVKMGSLVLSDRARDKLLQSLEPYSGTTELAQVKVTELQLRANTKQRITDTIIRKPIVSSGPLLLSQDALPCATLWQTKPVKDEDGNYIKAPRLPRSDRVLGQNLICKIGGYNLYEYLSAPKTDKRVKPAPGD